MREMANEYEKSLSAQREMIYEERDRVLKQWDIDKMALHQLATEVFQQAYRKQALNNEENLRNYIYQQISFKYTGQLEEIDLNREQAVVAHLVSLFEQQLAAQQQVIGDTYMFMRFVQKSILKAIDSNWIQQVDHLQQLRGSINNRQNGQRNAIFEYHRVALASFESMRDVIKTHIIHNLCQSVATFDKQGDLVIHFPN